ncbi:MAG: class II aldolase [Alphaproteobacteria bacterium]|nr:class II aldolase [Alphaproteobacteria bacterium]
MVRTARMLDASGLNRGTSGNVGARTGSGLLVTPTGVPAGKLAPGDIVALDWDGRARAGQKRPSSEWRIHRDVLAARPDVGAVVHAHPLFATALACQRRAIPAFHYMVAVAGGASIRCARYATFGTQALSDNVLAALRDRRACLMANHGMVAAGADLDRALALAIEVESLAAQYWHALQIGKPKLLAPAEMRRVLAKFASYGQR